MALPSPSLRLHRLHSLPPIFLMPEHWSLSGSESDSCGWVRQRVEAGWGPRGRDGASVESTPGRQQEVGPCLGSKFVNMLIVPLDFTEKTQIQR